MRGLAVPVFLGRLLCLGWVVTISVASVEAEERVIMSFPRFQEATHTIDRVDATARQALLTPRQVPVFLPAWEGPAVLLLSSTDANLPGTLVRVEVAEVLAEGAVRITYGDEAGAVISEGEATLGRPLAGDFTELPGARPQPAPTKAIRSLPDVLRLGGEKADGGGALDAITAARSAARRVQSMNNLKQIALAFHNYADAFGAFPPAVILGPDGKPWHSWRVLLLPFLEQAALCNAYDFSKPWDAPENRAVAETLVAVYRDPAREGTDSFTDYGAIVGEGAIFTPNLVQMKSPDDYPACLQRAKVSFRQVTDGTSNTIMFATLDPSRKIPWTKPEDILFGDDFPGVGAAAGIGAIHPAGDPAAKLGLVAFTDGSVRMIPGGLAGKVIAPFLTRSGGEVVDNEVLDVKGVAAEMQQRQPAVRIVEGDDGMVRFTLD